MAAPSTSEPKEPKEDTRIQILWRQDDFEKSNELRLGESYLNDALERNVHEKMHRRLAKRASATRRTQRGESDKSKSSKPRRA